MHDLLRWNPFVTWHVDVRQALVVYDVDGGVDSLLAVTLQCDAGELILGDALGLVFGDNQEETDLEASSAASAYEPPPPSGVVRFNGTAADINRAMRNLRYRGLPGRVGPDAIRITVTDDPLPCPGDFNGSVSDFNTTAATGVNGTSGAVAAPCSLGGPLTTDGVIEVYMSPVNHPPWVTVPPDGAITRTTVDALHAADIGAGGALSVEDPDVRDTAYYSAGGLRIEGPVTVAVSATSGRLSLDVRGGLSFAEGEGVSDPVLRFSGGIDDANRALATVSYRCSSTNGCGAGTHNVTVSVDDNGFTGKGGAMSANATFSVQVSIAGE